MNFISLGIRNHFSNDENNSIKLINIISIIGIVCSSLFLSFSLINSSAYLILDIICLVLFSLPPLLNKYNRQDYAKPILILSLIVMVGVGTYFAGYESNFKILIFIPIALFFILFNNSSRLKIFLFMILISVFLFVNEYLFFSELRLRPNADVIKYFYRLALFSVVLIGFVITQLLFLKKVKDVRNELIKHQEIILEKNKVLKSVNAVKDKFFNILAHDLRGPLGSLVNLSLHIKTKFVTYDKNKQSEFLLVFHKSLSNTFDLVEDLLKWSNLQSGKLSANPVKFSLIPVSNKAVLLFNESALEKNIKIKNEISDYYYALADKDMIFSVLRNLISNSIKFTPQGGNITCSSIYTEYNGNGFIQVSVKDNGLGMNEEIKENLFDITHKTSTLGTEKEEGSGIGLIVCKEFIELNGGRFWFESIKDEGTTFSFTIPVYN